ncbi:hypothetical protein PQ465_15365 [Sphingobacterium oryzagri]|uniref:MotA/TolQ/ExbB proton channel domain-containing protein n=1 Tax=Sphingobacterium oryzagri TaxID=3025669 RepID=A0ABY7WJX4_9SPHI|nr:hypothetical protein [Sphingobacterium sp. KACC 22765]WDF67679.1 hypothetical protein PQ465_15365 [Sphingobacterium sp. KACC 22765]
MWVNFFTITELLLIGVIVIYQFKIGVQLLGRISRYAAYIPFADYFFTEKVSISTTLVINGDVKAIFEEIDASNEEMSAADKSMINLINPRSSSGTHFDYIIESLNIYLLKNNGGIADFTIVKDLVERNVAVEDDDLKDSINKPLYLGLMATILGIIFGLFTMLIKMNDSSAAIEVGSNQLALDDFLLSVCIAMIASFIGLGITTLTGLKFFKDAKRKIEQRKNGFYNFVQTELLPVVSQDFGSSIAKLSQSMHHFNADFQTNVSSLAGLFQRNYETLKIQDDVLEKLQKINVQDFAKTNIAVLTRLEKSTGEFDKFNFFMENLNARLTETRELSANLTKLMDRVNNFESIANRIDMRITDSNKIITFIEREFSDMEAVRSKYTTMLRRVDDSLEDTLEEFSSHIKDKRVGLVSLINEQHELLEKAYVENKTKFDKLDLLEKLDKLDVLSEMNLHVREEKEQIMRVSDRLAKATEEMAQSIIQLKKREKSEESRKINQEHRSTLLLNEHETLISPSPKGGFWYRFKKIFKR